MISAVMGTAGHIDHGKSALVRALTGVDPDRLPDEKRRGITIDLGFARLPIDDTTSVSIIDVPGHEAFVRNMLAGATGIDFVLLVIAADEGVMPQTREHLAIIELLGIRRGVVALSKVDLAEPEWLDLVQDDVRQLIASTALREAPIVPVSARTGEGLDVLRARIAEAAAAATARNAGDLFRMPVDRVFTVRGTGTVATGTVWSGALARDAQVRVLPAGFSARVRTLQQHGVECAEVVAGSRAAVALAGVERTAFGRGDVIVTGDGWEPAGVLTVELRVLEDAPAPLRLRQRVRVHVGTAEVVGRLALTRDALEPGTVDFAQLRLEQPIVARAGDHFVLRSWSPVHTIAGGIVLEPTAGKRKRYPPPVRDALGVLARELAVRSGERTVADSARVVTATLSLAGHDGLRRASLPIVTGLDPGMADAAVRACEDADVVGDRIVPAHALRTIESSILDAVADWHRRHPMLDGIERDALRTTLGEPPLFDAALARLLEQGSVVAAGNAVARPEHSPVLDADAERARNQLAKIYRNAGLEPPDLDELPPELATRPDLALLIRFLERDGTLIRLSATRLIHTAALSEAVAAVRTQLTIGQELGIAEFKDVLKLTRKHLIPLLEHMDRMGVTRRVGDRRILPDAEPDV